MNLIEKLGGYEVVKKIVDDAPVDYIGYRSLAWSPSYGYSLTHPFEMIHGEYYLLYIKEKLLEHRRQNNIFEVGDKVVFGGSPFIHEVYEFNNKKDDNVYILGWGWTKFHLIKHATDKEIAQGYRDE